MARKSVSLVLKTYPQPQNQSNVASLKINDVSKHLIGDSDMRK
jgi:hypothetical protein